MRTGRSTGKILGIAAACLLIGSMAIAIGDVASAKGKPDRPPGQDTKAQATVQLQGIDSGTTSPTGEYRWLDVADQEYSESYQNSYNYTQATVKVSYSVVDGVLQGTLMASNLKPNFAYQLKLLGDPEAVPNANERIGLAGRWWQQEWNVSAWTNGGNSNDEAYLAEHEIADATSPTGLRYRFTGYMLFDYLITSGSGKASLSFRVDSSYHVLHKTTQRTRTSSDGPIKTATFDPSQTSQAYDIDYGPSTVSIYGQIERPPVGGKYPAPGSYTCQMILTEESFHGSGIGPVGNWAAAMGATVNFEIR